MNLENTSLDILKKDFQKVFTLSIPVEERPETTFLEISGFPHYEEVISNWYAFFLRSDGVHNFKTLFITSLIECYEEIRGKNSVFFALEETKVIRERMVNEKRIDLLVYDQIDTIGKDDDTYKNAFIIENKINATLYNELDSYYNGICAENKYGIVLTLLPLKMATSNFINITHQKLMSRVSDNIGKYLLKSNPKYLLMLREFIQQIQLFNKTIDMKATVDFYFENAAKINDLIKIKENAMDSIIDSIKSHIENTDFNWGRKYPEALNIRFKKDPQVLLTIDTSKIFIEGSYVINLWLSGELAKAWQHNKEIFNNLSSKPNDIIYNESPTGAQYAFVASEKVSFGLSKENIEKFPLLFSNHLQNSWAPFLNIAIEVLTSKNN